MLVYLAKSVYEMRVDLSEHLVEHQTMRSVLKFGFATLLTVAGLMIAWAKSR